ncbi:MAG: hypothetical protein HW380_364 [Magnetococcales bacterium]|nr:hypothetical protein [Magnetococcales bacterium]
MSTEVNNLKTILALIRDNKFDAAWSFLDTLLVTDPELVAQWYLLSQFVVRGDKRFGDEVRGALGEIGRAATRAFDGILAELETHKPVKFKISDPTDQGIERLEAFLGVIQQRLGEPEQGKTQNLTHDQQLVPLVHFLERVQRAHVERLDPVKRVEQRLDGLRRRMRDQGNTNNKPASGRHRLAERLTAFGGALGRTHKKEGRFVR